MLRLMRTLRRRVLLGVVAFSLIDLGPTPAEASPFLDRLEREVPILLQKHGEAGLAVAFVDGCQGHVRAYGLASREPARPMNADTVFNLGSVSKTLTAWTVMTLVERGQLRLDDPIDTYLRRWRLPQSTFDRRAVTVRRLLNHTAGLSLRSPSGVDRGPMMPSLIDVLEGRGPDKTAVQIVKEPGRGFEYSGGGYGILQLLVEDVTGEPFAQYARRAVFDPLGMSSTSFGWTSEAVEHAAVPYFGDGSVYPLQEFPVSAAAGLVSTAQDMRAFLLAHCAGVAGGPKRQVLAAHTLESMWTEGVKIPRLDQPARYALGYTVLPGWAAGSDIVGHGGSNPGWKAEFLLMPRPGLGIAVLSNGGNGNVRRAVSAMFRREAVSRLPRGPRLMHAVEGTLTAPAAAGCTGLAIVAGGSLFFVRGARSRRIARTLLGGGMMVLLAQAVFWLLR
jgi:CubicO group peptidase (beta-lactamase class C family)